MKYKINGLPEPNTWEFVEKFYKDYTRCGIVSYCNDLASFIDGTFSRKYYLQYHDAFPKTKKSAMLELKKLSKHLYALANTHFIKGVLSEEIVLVYNE